MTSCRRRLGYRRRQDFTARLSLSLPIACVRIRHQLLISTASSIVAPRSLLRLKKNTAAQIPMTMHRQAPEAATCDEQHGIMFEGKAPRPHVWARRHIGELYILPFSFPSMRTAIAFPTDGHDKGDAGIQRKHSPQFWRDDQFENLTIPILALCLTKSIIFIFRLDS